MVRFREAIVGGWKDPNYRAPVKRAPVARTPEQIKAEQAERDDFMRSMAASWGVAPEDVDLWINDPVAYRHKIDQQRALTKIEDRKARTAVEGDTDLNHDNVEAAE
jgi:hypothetical protein